MQIYVTVYPQIRPQDTSGERANARLCRAVAGAEGGEDYRCDAAKSAEEGLSKVVVSLLRETDVDDV